MIEEFFSIVTRVACVIVSAIALLVAAVEYDRDDSPAWYSGATPDCQCPDNSLPPTFSE